MTWGMRQISISEMGVDKVTKVVIQYNVHSQISRRSEWETSFPLCDVSFYTGTNYKFICML